MSKVICLCGESLDNWGQANSHFQTHDWAEAVMEIYKDYPDQCVCGERCTWDHWSELTDIDRKRHLTMLVLRGVK